MSPFFTSYVLAWCAEPYCEWYERVEQPTPAEQARVIRQARTHRDKTSHVVPIERAQSWSPA